MCAESSGRKKSGVRRADGSEVAKEVIRNNNKPMILIYSADMSFCFSMSSFFQDRYEVITTTDPELLRSLATIRSTRLVVIDDEPSRRTIERLQDLRCLNHNLPMLMVYVYGPGGGELDKTVRDHVDAVLYKPLNLNEISRSIEELIGG